jgi:hypothetical protein
MTLLYESCLGDRGGDVGVPCGGRWKQKIPCRGDGAFGAGTGDLWLAPERARGRAIVLGR